MGADEVKRPRQVASVWEDVEEAETAEEVTVADPRLLSALATSLGDELSKDEDEGLRRSEVQRPIVKATRNKIARIIAI